jgi:hypothetical protein
LLSRSSSARRRVAAFVAASGACLTAAALCPAVASADPSAPVVVVSGLNNPRQLSLVYTKLYVAEAGRGGKHDLGGGMFVGFTGSITAVDNPNTVSNAKPNRVVTGLLSGAGKDGSGAVGSDGVDALRSAPNHLYIQETAAPPGVPLPPPGNKLNGKLISATPNGDKNVIADIGAYEVAHNPDGQDVNPDPYAVLARAQGDQLVADAGGNDVLRVAPNGSLSVWHIFKNIPNCSGGGEGEAAALAARAAAGQPGPGCQFVPTSLAQDSKGHVYVGGLVALAPGRGQVVELSADGTKVLRTWRGFTGVTGVAVHDGNLYVSQLFADNGQGNLPGKLTKIAPSGSRTSVMVPFPAGVAVSNTGNVFVSAFSVSTAAGSMGPGSSGQVWRLRF